jgi:hypothetical protein
MARQTSLKKFHSGTNRIIRNGSLVLVVIIVGLVGIKLLTPSHAATSFLQGIYKGDFSQTPINNFEAFVGHKLDITEIFLDGSSNPAGGAPYYFTFPSDMQNTWKGRRLIIGAGGPFNTVTNCPSQAAQETYWSKMANGTYDSYVRTQAQNLVSSGHADTIIRMFHEYNGGWFPDCLYSTPTQVANFKTTFRNWVNIYRATPGQNFTIMWNPTYNPNNLGTMANVTNTYPGDDVVDAIGLDVYDDYMQGYVANTFTQTDAVRQAAFNNLLTRSDYGLNVWAAYAKSHGKQLDCPEWGMGYDGGSSGGDNTYFINGMSAFFKNPANNVGLESFWEESDCAATGPAPTYACTLIVPKGVSDPDAPSGITKRSYPVPNARAAFLADFGGSNGGSVITPTPIPTPTPTPVPTVSIPFHMRAGGADYTDNGGTAWKSDATYTADGSTDTQGVGKITGTTNTALYENERWNNPHLGYSVPVANGTYTLKLHFAEISPNVTAAGKRVFSGTAEGKSLFSNLDIFSEVGAYKPDDKTYTVAVSDGKLDLSLDSTVDAAKLSGLEILAGSTATPTPTPVSTPTPTTTPTPTPTGSPAPTPTPTGAAVAGDVSGDGHITSLDLAILLSNWNRGGATRAQGDLSGDGKVTSLDLAILLSNWGR